MVGERAPLGDGALAQLLRSLADAVIIADPAGTIVFWNDAAARLFGWSASDALGKSLDLIIPERFRARHWAAYRRVMETGHTRYGSQLLQVPALHRDGHGFSIAFTVTLLGEPEEHRPRAIAAVVRDNTENYALRRSVAARPDDAEGDDRRSAS